MKSELTQKKLKELLHYDPETGVFTWKISGKGIQKGRIAGCLKPSGYRTIVYQKKEYRAHRLAWLYVYGYVPEYGLDHKNRVRYHNWILNLREASQQCNIRNTGNRKDNTSGVKGVVWDKENNKWIAAIVVNKKYKGIGRYKNFTEAVCHRLAAEQCLDWSNCDSSSPAYKYVQRMFEEAI